MTNTRITDCEILERRYPVILHEVSLLASVFRRRNPFLIIFFVPSFKFSLRDGSGGQGIYKGGNGVVRDIEFTIPDVMVSILSEVSLLLPTSNRRSSD